MSWAVTKKVTASQKLVLLMLANHTNGHTGRCDPSLPTLADECCMSKNTVIDAIKSLEKLGLLWVIRRRYKGVSLPNRYVLALPGIERPVVEDGGEGTEPGGGYGGGVVQSLNGGGAVIAPEPGIEPYAPTVASLLPGRVPELFAPAPEEPPRGKPPRIPNCPTQRIVDLYHQILPMLPRMEVMTDLRRSLIAGRWRQAVSPDKDDPAGRDLNSGIEFFRDYFTFVAKSKFLTGQVNGSRGRDRPFRADLEWLMRPSNFAKVYEGRYSGD